MKIDFSDKFWSRVNIGDIEDCWEWQGGCNTSGYGNARYHGKDRVAHRVAAFLAGLITKLAAPKKRTTKGFVLHKCDNRKCCNPYHFFLGSYSDNQFDAYKKQRKIMERGEENAQAKLTNSDANFIRRLVKFGITKNSLAIKYKVTPRVIRMIIRNESYKI